MARRPEPAQRDINFGEAYHDGVYSHLDGRLHCPRKMSNPLSSAHGWVTTKIVSHPTGAAVTLAILTVLVIVLLITTLVYHSKAAKATSGFRKGHFSSPSSTPTWSGGMHSNWQNGSVQDQGYFGSGFQQYSQIGHNYNPAVFSQNKLRSDLKGGHHMRAARAKKAAHVTKVSRMRAARLAAARRAGQREGLVSADPAHDADYLDAEHAAEQSSDVGPLDAAAGYMGNDGGEWMFDGSTCPSTGSFDPLTGVMAVDPSTIGSVWDPEAISEAQALAAVGSYVNDPSGDEMAFQAAISSAYDSNAAADTMSDAQLTQMMQRGSAP